MIQEIAVEKNIIDVVDQILPNNNKKIIKDSSGRIHTIGKRKRAIARIFFKEGAGDIKINNIDLLKYFTRQELVNIAIAPLNILKSKNKFDIAIYVRGGGKTGQAGALSLAIAKALDIFNSENHQILKNNGLLTRDSRKVERKKYGLKKARKAPTFRKR
jgi:small subunit ribosomal protein S9